MTIDQVKPLRKVKKTVPIWLLTTILIALAIGVVAGLLLNNLLSSNQVSLSVTGLISFVFTVALGSASIILAIITIILSRQAEDALTRRSDEGIRLQNDVFLRTDEVLSKIQTSTGVTEKRIEDIFSSGRTTNIVVREAVEKSFGGKHELSGQAVEKLTKALAASLRSEFLPLLASEPRIRDERLNDMEREQRNREKITEEWKKYRTAVVNAVRRAPGLHLLSETEGFLGAIAPEEFWDAILDIEGWKVGFNILITRQFYDVDGSYYNVFLTPEGIDHFYAQISAYAIQAELTAVAFVFDEDVSEDEHFKDLLSMFERMEPQFKTVLLTGTPEQIVQAVQKQEWAANKQETEKNPEGDVETHSKRWIESS